MDNNNLNGKDKLPRELEEILLKNHPLKGHDEERVSARRRYSENTEDIKIKEEKDENITPSASVLDAIRSKAVKENAVPKEEVKKVSENTMKIDIAQIREAMKEAEEREEEETEKLKKAAEASEENEEEVKEENNELPKTKAKSFKQIEYTFDDDDYDYEPVQLVRHKSRDKSPSVPKKAEGRKADNKEKMFTNPQGENAFEEISQSITKSRPNPANILKKSVEKNDRKSDVINLEGKEKEAALDRFFEENDYEDDYESHGLKINNVKVAAIVGAVFVVLFLFFAIRSFSLSNSLNNANEQIAQLENVQQENEELKLSKLSLEEEISELKGEGDEVSGDGENAEGAEGETEESGEYDTYTVVAGDTFSGISMKVYGTYSGYAKIMAANGITDENSLQIGQQLKIPK